LDVELIAEEHVFATPHELNSQLVVDSIERDVPEAVVERVRDEEWQRGKRTRGAWNLRECHPGDSSRVVCCGHVADGKSGVMSDQGKPLVAQDIHQADEVVGESARVVPPPGLVGQPDAPLVDGDDREVSGQRRHHQTAYQFSGQPCTSSSAGPAPPITTCWRSPPARTKWLS
jgi:hypothetical protein